MKLSDIQTVMTLGIIGFGTYLVYSAYSGIKKIGSGIAKGAEEVVEGFVKVAPPETGTVPQWGGLRNVDPLMSYFDKNGITEASLNEAKKAGWTRDEINYAASAWATNQRAKSGDWY